MTRPDMRHESDKGPAVSAREASVVFAVALLLRLAALWVLDNPCEIGGKETSWDWGYEQAAIAQALARGEGFSDAFAQGTGPTGWSAPVFPAALALLIRVFGEIGRDLATALAVLQALVSAATCVALGRLGTALGRALDTVPGGAGGDRAAWLGRLAAWAWALHPGAIYYSVNLPWDSTWVACGIALFLSALVRRGPRPERGAVLSLGVGYGALLLVNPAPAALLPAVLVYLARGLGVRTALVHSALFCTAALVVLSPWMVRNSARLGSAGIRTNLGVELMVGNCDGAEGQFNGALHPAYNSEELALYVELGERDYARDAARRARAWARAHPRRFAELCGIRVARFWFGRSPLDGIPLGDGTRRERDWMGWVKWALHGGVGFLAIAGAFFLRGRREDVLLMRAVLFLFPVVYYVTHVFERYRLPIEPLLTLVVVWAAVSLRSVARR